MKIKKLALAISILSAGSIATVAMAAEDAKVLEEVKILGSYITGTDTAAANPVSVLTAEQMQYTGSTDVTDMLNTLSVNSGAENRPDTFTSFYSQGTSNVNLRGLGLSSTLVLINGRRQTISGAKAQDGSTFVDTASIPAIALERLEVLALAKRILYSPHPLCAGVI
jgi:iron complex outermembrane recepter protein